MRTSLRLAAAGAALAAAVSFGGVANAATTANATASAEILSTLTVTKTKDLDFGQIAANGAGTLAITGAGASTCSASLVCTGTRQVADFTVTGTAGSAVLATVTTPSITLSDGASHTMTVNAFNIYYPAGTTLAGGSTTFNVGGTLSVGAAQVAGAYTGSFAVSVEYQ
ncbi:MAG: DUF4402 domain-containing protein [Sphingomonadales bacterium]|nr:DUF4402 domain-containing protein [Sphingomonadales bacterium]